MKNSEIKDEFKAKGLADEVMGFGALFLVTCYAGVLGTGQFSHSVSFKLDRIPAHLAFWFGWYAQFPDTLLIK